MYSINTSSTNSKQYSEGYFITYDNVLEIDRKLLEKNLNYLFDKKISYLGISPLSGGQSTDRLYLGKLENRKIVIRFTADANAKNYLKLLSYSQMAAQNQVGPAVLYFNAEDKLFVTDFVEGTPLSPTLCDNEMVVFQLGRALRNIHHSQISLEEKFDILELVIKQLRNFIEKHKDFDSWMKNFLEYFQEIYTILNKNRLLYRPCHNDIHTMNVFLDLNHDIKFIDWGDAGLGDPYYDLARASIEFQFSKEQTEKFLSTYFLENITSYDRAHFFLLRQVALLKIVLHFLNSSELTDRTKNLVVSFFNKNEIELSSEQINNAQDVAKYIFTTLEKEISSSDSIQALLTLRNYSLDL